MVNIVFGFVFFFFADSTNTDSLIIGKDTIGLNIKKENITKVGKEKFLMTDSVLYIYEKIFWRKYF